MMKNYMIAFATLATLAATSAIAGPIPTDGLWRGNLGGSLSMTSGNSKSTNLAVGTDAVSADAMGKTSLYLNALRASSEANGVNSTTANLLRGGGRYEYNLSPQTYGFGSLDLERDPIQALKLRSALGAGLGYHVINTADTLFDVFGGIGYKIERFDLPAPADSNNATELILGEESNHKLSDTSSFKQRLTLYPNLKDSGEYRAVFDAGFTTAIAGGWNLNVGLSDRYNSQAPAGAKKNDLLFTTGVSAKFGAPIK
jgi:putative salt-induced outer membrane protein